MTRKMKIVCTACYSAWKPIIQGVLSLLKLTSSTIGLAGAWKDAVKPVNLVELMTSRC